MLIRKTRPRPAFSLLREAIEYVFVLLVMTVRFQSDLFISLSPFDKADCPERVKFPRHVIYLARSPPSPSAAARHLLRYAHRPWNNFDLRRWSTYFLFVIKKKSLANYRSVAEFVFKSLIWLLGKLSNNDLTKIDLVIELQKFLNNRRSAETQFSPSPSSTPRAHAVL